MKCRYAILAQRSITSSHPYNTVSLIDIVEELHIGDPPPDMPPLPDEVCLAGNFVFASLWEAESEDERTAERIEGIYRLETPSGPRGETPISLTFNGGVRSRIAINIQEIVFNKPGTYTFLLEFEETVASWDIKISLGTPAGL